MSEPLFRAGQTVLMEYCGERKMTKIVRHLPHPEGYEGVMEELYEISDGRVLKERYLRSFFRRIKSEVVIS
jgi:hypothetical protein